MPKNSKPGDGNRTERITFRVDDETATALSRYLTHTKDKKSAVVHRALHEFLMANDPEYRKSVEDETEK